MANGYHGDLAITLPNVFLPIGQAIQEDINVQQRQKQLDAEQKRYEQQRQETEDYRKSNILERNADPLKYRTGVEMFDDWTNKKAEEILFKFTNDPKYRNMDAATFTGELNRAWLPVINGYATVKGKLEQELQGIKEIASKNPWLNTDTLTRDVYNEIATQYVHPNEENEITFKPTDRVQTNNNIAASLLAADDSHKYLSESAISDFNKSWQKIPTEGEKFFQLTPQGTISYFGKRTPFQIPNLQADEKRFVKGLPQYNFITEGRTDEMGNPVNSISNELMDAYITNTPGNKMVYEKLFSEYAGKRGIDLSKMTPDDIEEEKAKFNYILAKQHIPNSPKQYGFQPAPQPRIGGNTVTKQATEELDKYINDFVISASQNDNDAVQQLGAKLTRGSGNREFLEARTELKNGVPTLFIKTTKKGATDPTDIAENTTITEIPVNDLEKAKSKLIGIYQSIMSSDKVAESLPEEVKGGIKPKIKHKKGVLD